MLCVTELESLLAVGVLRPLLFLAFGRSQGQFATTATAMLTTTTATAGQAEEPPPCLSVSLYRSCRPLRRPCRSYRCSTSTAFSSLSHVLVGAGNNFATSHCHRAPQFFSGTNAIDNTNPCSPHFPSSSFGACRGRYPLPSSLHGSDWLPAGTLVARRY